MKWASLLVAALVCGSGCSSIEVVRLQPGMLRVPLKTEPLAALQVSCVGFYAFTLGIPSCDLEKVINELLLKKAGELGAYKLLRLRFRQTPEGGIWWLTKLLWFRTARAWAIAVVREPSAGRATSALDLSSAGEGRVTAPPSSGAASRPASQPASRPGARGGGR